MAARQLREVARRFSSCAKNRGQALVLEVLSVGRVRDTCRLL